MTLRELLDAAGIAAPPGDRGRDDVPIAGLAYRSEGVTPGTLFFCVPGFVVDGHEFAADAVRRGAAALVCERPLGTDVPEVVVPSVRAAMGPLAAAFHGRPTAQLRVAGVTGTNGKTTTAFLARHVLEAAGIRTGLLGTVHSVVGGRVEEVERTTPEAVDLQATFARMLAAGDRACVMEVSSHALDLHRAAGIEFDCAVFTNLTQDHLDFHGTHGRLLRRQAEAVPAGRRPTADGRRCQHRRRMGPKPRRLRSDDGRRSPSRSTGMPTTAPAACATTRPGSSFECSTAAGAVEVRVPLPGLFNVYNSLAAIAAGGALGVPLDVAAAALQNRHAACRAASSPSRRARGSGSWWTTRTRRTRSRTCWSPPVSCSSRRAARAG